MAIVEYLLADGSTIRADSGRMRENVMTLARRAGVPGNIGECGGYMACATCHVHVAPEWMAVVGPAVGEEREIIAMTDDPRPESRLGCQIWLENDLDGLQVRVAT